MSEYTGKKVSTFRERFIELCDANPKGTTALAKELHVSRQTINAWKAGTRSPKQLTVVAISEYFDVSIPWLMGFDSEKKRPNLNDPLYFFDEKLDAEDEATLDRLLDLLVDLSKTNRRMAKNIILGLMEGPGN